jgi:pimeloyl-ACP methyl ester carboxylesterase
MRSIVISTHEECHAAVYHLVEVANRVQTELVFSRHLLTEEEQKQFSEKRLNAAEACDAAYQLKNHLKLGANDLFLLVVDGNLYDDEDDEYFFVAGANYSLTGKECSTGVAIISLFFLRAQSAFMKDAGTWWTSLRETSRRRKSSDCVLLLILGALAQEITELTCHKEMRRCVMDYCQTPAEIIEAANGKFEFCAQDCLPSLSEHLQGQSLRAIAQGLSDTPLPIYVLEPESANPVLANDKVVMSLHGIRTRGAWQKTISSQLGYAGFIYQPLDFGFFRAVKLLVPSYRTKQVEWFLDEYTRAGQQGEKKISVIAHSFGTYVVAGALDKYAEVKLESVIFCGSIVRRNFEWSRMIPDQVGRVLNDCGKRDIWVRLAEWLIADAGPSGARGFTDDASGHVQQQIRPKFRHSDYFYSLNYQKTWIPFLKGEALALGAEGETPFRNWRFLLVKVAVALALGVLIVWLLVK